MLYYDLYYDLYPDKQVNANAMCALIDSHCHAIYSTI